MSVKYVFWSAIAAILILGISVCRLSAQEDKDIIAHHDVFGELQRPPVEFSHDLHMDVLSDQGCGVCHHVYDEKAGKLVYEEGEESGCNTCHGLKKIGQMPALREAYHGSCTACHRQMHKDKMKAGPITCGECHPKR